MKHAIRAYMEDVDEIPVKEEPLPQPVMSPPTVPPEEPVAIVAVATVATVDVPQVANVNRQDEEYSENYSEAEEP